MQYVRGNSTGLGLVHIWIATKGGTLSEKSHSRDHINCGGGGAGGPTSLFWRGGGLVGRGGGGGGFWTGPSLYYMVDGRSINNMVPGF